MRYGNDTNPGPPFDTDNRAWQRFTSVAADHFDVITWTRPDDRPVMVSLIDLHTGDTFTVGILDSLEVRDPHVLLVLSTTDGLTVHGPADGPAAAADHAPYLALTRIDVQATQPVPLHHPTSTDVPETAWIDLPPAPVTTLPNDDSGAHTVALLLIDPEHDRLAAVGPFPDRETADKWQPTDSRTIERHLAPLQPIPPASPRLP